MVTSLPVAHAAACAGNAPEKNPLAMKMTVKRLMTPRRKSKDGNEILFVLARRFNLRFGSICFPGLSARIRRPDSIGRPDPVPSLARGGSGLQYVAVAMKVRMSW